MKEGTQLLRKTAQGEALVTIFRAEGSTGWFKLYGYVWKIRKKKGKITDCPLPLDGKGAIYSEL